MSSDEASLYWIKSHEFEAAILESPSVLNNVHIAKDFFNILMIDVSGSMSPWWAPLLQSWNEHIAAKLSGTTLLYTFGNVIKQRGTDPFLQDSHFDRASTNLTAAIGEINKQVRQTLHSEVRIFLVTDGHHNATRIEPQVEIEKLCPPASKSVEVFLLGLGSSFPVEYSIGIRSRLHNGNSNMPSLFWAQEVDDLSSQISSIEDILKGISLKMTLSIPGSLAPGLAKTDETYLGEFVYYDEDLESISQLKFSIQGSEENQDIEVNVCNKDLTLQLFLDKILRQWNSLLIQQHKKNKEVPMSIFDTIDLIFKELMSQIDSSLIDVKTPSISNRLEKKKIKTLENTYATLINQSKKIIGIEGMYQSELELAKDILKTTVQSKYDLKNLKMKGYGDESYQEDVKVFLSTYNKFKKSIMALPEPSLDECCAVTLGSTIKDLQDENFKLLLKEDKFTLMKTLSVTGIPVLTSIRDASQINPWTLKIKNILVNPFAIASISVLELAAEVHTLTEENKSVYLQEGEESSHLNAIVPIFNEEAAKVLKPLIRTNIFGMLCTFCILKNPHIIDMNVHLAALSAMFMKTIRSFPKKNRPEFINVRLSLIKSTAGVYLDRKGYKKYMDVLSSAPKEAIMTESKELFDDATIKCESLIKPCFFIYLMRDNLSYEQKRELMELLVLEFIGRCLSSYQPEQGVGEFSCFFAKGLYTAEDRAKWIATQIQDKVNEFDLNKENVLNAVFTEEDLVKKIDVYGAESFGKISNAFEIKVNMAKVHRLYNLSSAGDINLKSLQIFADEINILPQDIKSIFSKDQMLTCVTHSLLHRHSRDRLSTSILEYKEAVALLGKKIASENTFAMRNALKENLKESLIGQWKKELVRVHADFIAPFSKEDLIQKATERGVVVSDATFNKIYKYNPATGLIRNACMVEACPHFLQPSRSFNQHLYISRQDRFPHELHRVALSVAQKGGNAEQVIKELVSGNCGGTNNRQKPNPPPLEAVSSLEVQIDLLLKQYKKFCGIKM